MTQVKFCGIKNSETLQAINALTYPYLKYVGFVLAPSKRQVDINHLKSLCAELDTKYKKVGVFVNPTTEDLELGIKSGIQVLQFHGDENESSIRQQLESIYGRAKPKDIEIWKALRVGAKGVCHEILPQSGESESEQISDKDTPSIVDKYLLDKWDSMVFGGTGESFDWSLLRQMSISKRKIIIAGGVNEHNINDLLSYYRPAVVDLSSGIETHGEKDLKKMIAFLEAFKESADIGC